jgi:hypothetical protein
LPNESKFGGSILGRASIKIAHFLYLVIFLLLIHRNEISNLYRGPSIDASYQVSIHLAKQFQRKEDFLTLANQKQESPVKSAHFVLIH